MKKGLFLVLFCAFLLFSNKASAIVLGGEYSILPTVTPIDADSYTFSYAVTNINQQAEAMTGLDGFYLQVPNSAVISNIVTPSSYVLGGSWISGTNNDPNPMSTYGGNAPEAALQPGNLWLYWWGLNPQSVYPIGSTATFGFQADGVSLGTSIASPITYWANQTPLSPSFPVNNSSYTVFSTQVPGPSVIPEPASMSLLGLGLLGLIGLRKKREA